MPDDAVIHIYVEDVSFADAESSVIAEKELSAGSWKTANGEHQSAGAETTNRISVSFEIEIDEKLVKPKNDNSVRVWIDARGGRRNGGEKKAAVTGTEQPFRDFYSTEAYPVLTRGNKNIVQIAVS